MDGRSVGGTERRVIEELPLLKTLLPAGVQVLLFQLENTYVLCSFHWLSDVQVPRINRIGKSIILIKCAYFSKITFDLLGQT